MRRRTAIAFALGIAATSPAFLVGFCTDDFLHLAEVEGALPDALGEHPLDLYRYADGSVPVEEGIFPWWTDRSLRLAFFRPLGSALFRLDHALFAERALFYHAHSLLWWIALLASAALVLRRRVPPAIGGLALIVFAVDDAHVFPVGWIACRHALVAMTFALVALYAHVRKREGGSARWAVLSSAAMVLAFAASEAGLAAPLYIAAYEAFGRSGARGARFAALIPAAIVCIAYGATVLALGYGVRASGAYCDPLHEPARFAVLAASRLPIYLANLLFSIPAEVATGGEEAVRITTAVGIGATMLFVLLARVAHRHLSDEERRAARWLGAGAMLSLLPVLGGHLGSRVLVVALPGASVVIAAVLVGLARAFRSSGRARWLLGVALASLFALHVVLAPPLLALTMIGLARIAESGERAVRTAELGPDPTEAHVFVLSTDVPRAAHWAFAVRRRDPTLWVRGWSYVSMAPRDHRVVRIDERRFRLEVIDGELFDTAYERIFRRPEQPFRAPIASGIATIRVLDRSRIELELDRSLDDPSVRFVAWRDGALRAVTMPPPGRTIVVRYRPGPL